MSLSMTVTREGIPPGARFSWERAAGMWAREAAPLAQGMLRARAPFRTGAFRASITDRREPGPGSMLVTLYSASPYAPFIVGGTKPHAITARNARALRWTGPGGMGVHFAKSVRHPGTKPNPFAEDAMHLVGPAVARLFAVAVQEAMLS